MLTVPLGVTVKHKGSGPESRFDRARQITVALDTDGERTDRFIEIESAATPGKAIWWYHEGDEYPGHGYTDTAALRRLASQLRQLAREIDEAEASRARTSVS